MIDHRNLKLAVIVAAGFLTVSTAPAWDPDGLPICTEPGTQEALQLVASDDGGFLIIWQDNRNSHWDIFAQRYDKTGRAMWDGPELAICTAAGDQTDPRAVTDQFGGFFVVWTDARDGYDIYGQYVDVSGTIQWDPDGIPICDAPRNQLDARIAADGHGGAVVVWTDTRGFVPDIYAQRVDDFVGIAWADDGVAVCTHIAEQVSPELAVQSGLDYYSTRVVVVWEDSRSLGTTGIDIYAQRLTLDGGVEWGVASGAAVTTDTDDQFAPLVVDGLDGTSIIGWTRDHSAQYSILFGLQKLDSNGISYAWDSGNRGHLNRLAMDGSGGVIAGHTELTWDPPEGDVTVGRVSRFHSSGSQLFSHRLEDGVATSGTTDSGVRIAADGARGCLATYYGYWGSHPRVILAKRLDGYGEDDVWGLGDLVVCESAGDHWNPETIMLDDGHGLVAWIDGRADSGDIYAQRLDYADGAWGFMPPVILDIADLAGDEGGAVTVQIDASDRDINNPVSNPVTGYNIWRRLPTAPAARTELDDAQIQARLIDPTIAGGVRLGGEQAARFDLPEGDWISLGFHAAMQQRQYSLLVPTPSDSSATGTPWETYVVTAHTTTPALFYVSKPDSGYSVDNLAPALLQGLAAVASADPPGLDLTWQAAPESDLAHYVVHRDTEAGFDPDGGNLIATPVTAGWFDSEWIIADGFHYQVAAVDRHDNVGPYAAIAADEVIGVDLPGAPTVTVLRQNQPNPFNPSTVIVFDLANNGRVDLQVFDVSGRLVRQLVIDQSMLAGHHQIRWDGRDRWGRHMPSATYYYRLEAGDHVETRCMTLLK